MSDQPEPVVAQPVEGDPAPVEVEVNVNPEPDDDEVPVIQPAHTDGGTVEIEEPGRGGAAVEVEVDVEPAADDDDVS